MRIFLTGASGCIGHYLVESLIQETEHELFLLVRNPQKLKVDIQQREGVNIIQGDLEEIEKLADLLKTINVAILAATCWGGTKESFEINVDKTLSLINLLAPENCQQVIYFSTASILNQQNQLLPEAGEIGTDYIRTKYECYIKLKEQKIANKITTVFPTLVFGGEGNKPYSHLSAGLGDVIKWISLARWFKADGSFHFIHAKDIAQVVTYLVDNPSQNPQIVIANEAVTVNQAVEEICEYVDKKIYIRVPLPLWLGNIFIKTFNIKMAEWDRFCLDYRHFTYQNPINPAKLGLTPYCPTITNLLKKGT